MNNAIDLFTYTFRLIEFQAGYEVILKCVITLVSSKPQTMNNRLNHTFKISLLLWIAMFSLTNYSMGQTPGQIFFPSDRSSLVSALDPNSDGYITSSGSSFTGNGDEIYEFENEWVIGYQLQSEPIGDANTGSTCSQVDVVNPNGDQYAYYMSVYNPDGYPTNADGDEYFIGRIRIGKDPGTGNFGYSILLDIDGTFGNGNDLNYVSGNSGFEIEIRFKKWWWRKRSISG